MKNGYRVFRVSLFVKIADADKPLSRLIPPKGLHKVRFIKVKWSPYLAPFILEIRRGFTLYEVKTFLSFDSIYSKKLCSFLKTSLYRVVFVLIVSIPAVELFSYTFFDDGFAIHFISSYSNETLTGKAKLTIWRYYPNSFIYGASQLQPIGKSYRGWAHLI